MGELLKKIGVGSGTTVRNDAELSGFCTAGTCTQTGADSRILFKCIDKCIYVLYFNRNIDT